MNELFKAINGQVRTVVAIENIERNIAIRYTNSLLIVFFAFCVFGFGELLGMAGHPKLYIMMLCYGVAGVCLAGYLVIGAYSIQKKLNLLLEEMAQGKEEEKEDGS